MVIDVDLAEPESEDHKKVSDTHQKYDGEALIRCVQETDVEELRKIINSDVDINYQDTSGMTALHYAAMIDARACTRILVGTGKCDYLIRDNQGQYASQLALEWGEDIGVAVLLAKKQARQAYERDVPIFEST